MKLNLLSFLAFLFTLNSFALYLPQQVPDTTRTDTLKTENLIVVDTVKTADTLLIVYPLKSAGSLKASDSIKTTQILRSTTDLAKVEADVEEKIIYWTEKNAVGVNLNEVAFFNWNAGGNNSVSALLHGNFERNFRKDLLSWKNRMGIRYGLNAQEGREVRKTEDELAINSNFSYRSDSTSNWHYSARLNFNTQLANGYRYPDTDNAISKFMAPGYLFIGIGGEYSGPKEELNLYISPLTQKSTFVLEQRLANEGMYGVQPAAFDEFGNMIRGGQKVRTEIGILFTSSYATQMFQNVSMNHNMTMYTDYLNKFGNIDVDWQLNFNMKVNDFIKAQVGTHLRYDDDVKHKEDTNGDGELETVGPRVQFKQMLGVGFVYEF